MNVLVDLGVDFVETSMQSRLLTMKAQAGEAERDDYVGAFEAEHAGAFGVVKRVGASPGRRGRTRMWAGCVLNTTSVPSGETS